MRIPTLSIGKNHRSDIPIVQGGMGVRVSLAGLAAAVANEGGIGTIPGSGSATSKGRSRTTSASAAKLCGRGDPAGTQPD